MSGNRLIMLAVAAGSGLSDAHVARAGLSDPVPPPPALSRDAVPGSFIAFVDSHGALRDPGVIANALHHWGGPKESAFILCFRPAAMPVDWRQVLAALDHVSNALAARGAVAVTQAARLCTAPATVANQRRPYVEMMGVLGAHQPESDDPEPN